MQPLIVAIALAAMGGASLFANPFAAPAEGPVPFRRDRLPLDIDTMYRLSDQLKALARLQKLALPEQRRNIAQILALSLALNPANNNAREDLEQLIKGGQLAPVEFDRGDEILQQLRLVLLWLENPEAGADGHELAMALSDIILAFGTPDPVALALAAKQERGRWAGWIPEINSFTKSQVAGIEPEKDDGPPVDFFAKPVPEAEIKLARASILTPLWVKNSDAEPPKLIPVLISVSASLGNEEKDNAAPAVQFGSSPEDPSATKLNRTLGKLLQSQIATMPKNFRAVFTPEEENRVIISRNPEAISGATAALLGAVASGLEPAGTVIGQITADGAFKCPPDFWERLRAVASAPGGRLVIPTEGAGLLPLILAMDQPEFFLKNQVLLASNLTELQERSAKSAVTPLADALSKFHDIQTKAGGMQTGPYVANRFVRQRLTDLSSEAPYFASARLLALQATGNKPNRLPRQILAFELLRAVGPTAWLPGAEMNSIDIALLDKSYESAREAVDSLERYVDTPDRVFFTSVREMTTKLRSFSRASRVAGGRDDGYELLTQAFESMMRTHKAVLAELVQTSGTGNAAPDPAGE